MDHLRELSLSHIDPRGLGSALFPASHGRKTELEVVGTEENKRTMTMVMSAIDTSIMLNSIVNPKLNKIFFFSNWSHLLQNLK